jgi:hypothetical protein
VGSAIRHRYRAIGIALLFWLLAGSLYTGRRAVFGDRPAAVHVRWAATVTDSERRRLEGLYRLTAPQPTDGRTFAYALTDVSGANVQALVLDPAVEDTHEINRTSYRIGFFSPRLPYPTRHPAVPRAMDALALLCLVLGVAWTTVRGGLARAARWIGERIPEASPEAVALFRMIFGACLLTVIFRRPVAAALAADTSNVISGIHRAALQMLAEVPWMVDGLLWWIGFWGVLFIFGAFARLAFASLTAGVLVWALLYTTTTTYHTVSSLLLALLVLQWSRWSDAWSVDAWRRGRIQKADAREYGFTVWVPGVVLGVVYAAAAAAKLLDTGIAWVLNGTVKYHFLSDSPQAMVDWGLWIGRSALLSVLLSFGAVAVEALVIAGALARAYRYRLLAGAASLCLLAGFALFQGLFWPGWWMLLLSFLPWHLVPGPFEGGHHVTSGHASSVRLQPDRAGGFPRTPAFIVMALMALQVAVSLLRAEVSPLLSTYDIYATTYGSPAEYEQKAGQAYWIVGKDADAMPHRCRISRGEADAFAGAAATEPRAAGSLMRRCFDPSLDIRNVSLEASRVHIDWERWERLDEPIRVPLTSEIPLDSVR